MRTDEDFLQAVRKWIRRNHKETTRKLGRMDLDVTDEQVEMLLPSYVMMLPKRVQDVPSLEEYLNQIEEFKRRRAESGEVSLVDEYLQQRSENP